MTGQKLQLGPVILAIFGAAGDLTWRKLVPALFNLYLSGLLPEDFAVIGIDIKEMSLDELREHLRQGVDQFSRRGKAQDSDWTAFSTRIADYVVGDFSKPDIFLTVRGKIEELERGWENPAVHIFYQATPPSTVQDIVEQLQHAGLARDGQRARMVLEKPFGWDLASARMLNQMLLKVFEETQIYRIDHYLGKETVQNIMAFRFANAMFEPIWDRRYIDHVQITVAETIGVGHRGGYYNKAGAMRDMVPNHLMQLLSLIAMEPPVSFNADEVRTKMTDVLHAVRPIHPDEVHRFAARGQYAAGWIEGERVPAYREEPSVPPNSNTETFAAIKLFLDNWRWQGVPFYLRTGKRLQEYISEVCIQFQPVPHQSFPAAAVGGWRANSLIIQIQPSEGIEIHFQAKRPGESLRLSPVSLNFNYCDAFGAVPPEAYETLLLDVMRGDMTLFKRADQVEASWEVVMPILENWENTTPEFPNYPAGTWGPDAAQILIAQDSRSWLMPEVVPEHGQRVDRCAIVREDK
ncbi:MAG TPA: glucose-6-phosphate dehydrogenase [Armatimonadota bacterium]|jgi:glucose-6-phosphate 1-dehydrogenase